MKDYKKISKNPAIHLIPLPKREDEIYFDIYSSAGILSEKDNGVAHLFEHYVMGLIAEEKKIDFLICNGRINEDRVNFYFSSPKKDFLKGLEVFLKNIFQSDFSHKDIFSYELKSIINEFSQDGTLSGKIDAELQKHLSYQLHLKPNPTEKELKKLNIQKMKDFYKKVFLKSKTEFFFGGYKLDEDLIKQSMKMILKYSAGLKSINKKKTEKKNPAVIQGVHFKEIKDKGIKKGILALAIFSGMSIFYNSPTERIAMSILSSVLFDGRSNISSLVRRAGIYSVSLKTEFMQKFGRMGITASCSNEQQIKKLIEIVRKDIDINKENFQYGKELERIKKYILKNQKKAWKENRDRYNWISADIFNEEKVIAEDYQKIIKQLTPKYLQKILKKYFDWNNCLLVFAHKGIKFDLNKAIGKKK